jgi:hypothetical protein
LIVYHRLEKGKPRKGFCMKLEKLVEKAKSPEPDKESVQAKNPHEGKYLHKGLFVHGTIKRKAKSKPIIDEATGKVIGRQWDSRDAQPIEYINKHGQHVVCLLDITGRYGDQNHAERIPSKIITAGRPGKRKDKRAKKIWKGNLCHRVSSQPGQEKARTAFLVKQKLARKLSNLAKVFIGQHGSDRGIGLDPQISLVLRECHLEGIEKKIIRRALRGANV